MARKEHSQGQGDDPLAMLNVTLRLLAAGRELQLSALAAEIGLTAQMLTDRMRGRTEWKAADLVRLTSYLGCSIDDLLNPTLGFILGRDDGAGAEPVESAPPVNRFRGSSIGRARDC